jgi:poly-gamma-glutamate capsule biosynthesis protein CapA/YwtB (metallophosphatase superfamily)
VFGGDFFVARKFNEVVHDPTRWDNVFSRELTGLITNADAAVFNAEGVISTGGEFSGKRELDPYMYRAHPDAIRILARFGVDAVGVANNHTGDYGPDAFREMIDRLEAAGIGHFGGGRSRAEAEEPAYLRVGDAVVAIVGGDLSRPGGNGATDSRPGTLSFDWRTLGDDREEILAVYARILARARRVAHVVLFSPHWGENWEQAPSAEIRDLARGMIELGYDGILGHSAHLSQGVELIDGKPVIYDAGNALVDYPIDNVKWPSMLWRIELNRAGVVTLEGLPLRLGRNRTERARDDLASGVLAHVRRRSEDLGTAVGGTGGALAIACRPGEMYQPKDPVPRREAGPIRQAPSHLFVDTLPVGTIPARARFSNGVELVGFRVAPEAITPRLGAALVQLFFRAETTPKASVQVRLRAIETGKDGRPVGTKEERHIPGDWMLPVDKWPAGRIVLDEAVFRLRPGDGNTISFQVALGDEAVLEVAGTGAPPARDGWITLGSRPVSRDAGTFFEAIARMRRQGRW